jgi:two-component system, chemotaxis family, protein-glutamate methylesterase/glutaminase
MTAKQQREQPAEQSRDMVVVGASAGGVEALRALVGGLPGDFGASVFVVLHMPPDAPSQLPRILARDSRLPVSAAEDGQTITRGRVYVAVPDRHLVLDDGRLRLARGPRQNRARPAVDPLFRSAALHYGSRVVGVVLTGNLDDGTAGLKSIKDRGGIALVQDPDDALFPGMPASARRRVPVDHVAPLSEIPKVLATLCRQPASQSPPPSPRLILESSVDVGEGPMRDSNEEMGQIATPTAFICPDCQGGLWEVKDPDLLMFRCRVGHSYSPETLLSGKHDDLEGTLWSAVQALEESASLGRRVAKRLGVAGSPRSIQLEERARNAMVQADRLRDILMSLPVEHNEVQG